MSEVAEREVIWLDRIRRWEASGMTLKAFAEQEGCNRWTLGWWRLQVARHGRGRDEGRVVALARVRVVDEAASGGGRVEIAVGKHRVHVEPGFDGPTLERVIGILEARS